MKELCNSTIITKKNIPLKNCKSGEINFSSNFTKHVEDLITRYVSKDDMNEKEELKESSVMDNFNVIEKSHDKQIALSAMKSDIKNLENEGTDKEKTQMSMTVIESGHLILTIHKGINLMKTE